jgi:hypothetical protein
MNHSPSSDYDNDLATPAAGQQPRFHAMMMRENSSPPLPDMSVRSAQTPLLNYVPSSSLIEQRGLLAAQRRLGAGRQQMSVPVAAARTGAAAAQAMRGQVSLDYVDTSIDDDTVTPANHQQRKFSQPNNAAIAGKSMVGSSSGYQTSSTSDQSNTSSPVERQQLQQQQHVVINEQYEMYRPKLPLHSAAHMRQQATSDIHDEHLLTRGTTAVSPPPPQPPPKPWHSGMLMTPSPPPPPPQPHISTLRSTTSSSSSSSAHTTPAHQLRAPPRHQQVQPAAGPLQRMPSVPATAVNGGGDGASDMVSSWMSMQPVLDRLQQLEDELQAELNRSRQKEHIIEEQVRVKVMFKFGDTFLQARAIRALTHEKRQLQRVGTQCADDKPQHKQPLTVVHVDSIDA